MKKSDRPIVVEQEFSDHPEKLWQALTDPDKMRQWFFDQITDFRPEVGFHTQFMIMNEGRTFTHLWTIIEVVPLQKIVYNWTYMEYPGDSNVCFEIEPRGSGSLLRVSTEVLEDFPEDVPEFRRESCEAGWQYFIQKSLLNYLGR